MNKKNALKVGAGIVAAATAGFLTGKMEKKAQQSGHVQEEFENLKLDPEKELIEGITKEMVIGYIKKLLLLFNKMDVREAFDEYDISEDLLVTACARTTADAIYEKLKASFRVVPTIRNTDEQGQDIVGMESELFYGPAVCIYRENEESCFSYSDLFNDREIWMVADQEGYFAVVRCIEHHYKGACLVYRYVERIVEFEEDIICDLETLCGWLFSSYGSGGTEDGETC